MEIDDYWEDFRLLSSTVTVPVLFFIGKYDRSIGPESYKDVHFPNAVIRTGDCGHFPFLESPEEWAAALDDYRNLCDGERSFHPSQLAGSQKKYLWLEVGKHQPATEALRIPTRNACQFHSLITPARNVC